MLVAFACLNHSSIPERLRPPRPSVHSLERTRDALAESERSSPYVSGSGNPQAQTRQVPLICQRFVFSDSLLEMVRALLAAGVAAQQTHEGYGWALSDKRRMTIVPALTVNQTANESLKPTSFVAIIYFSVACQVTRGQTLRFRS